MDGKTAGQYAVRALSETKVGEARVYDGIVLHYVQVSKACVDTLIRVKQIMDSYQQSF